jgi:peptidoglycan hydrolase-like protein with peptidoglycan-binding domain
LELAMNTPPIISVGATGPTVTWAQYLLVRWTLSYTQIFGIFRPVTKTAVEQFQAESHLAVLNAFRGRALRMTHLPVAGIAGASLPASRGSEPGGA